LSFYKSKISLNDGYLSNYIFAAKPRTFHASATKLLQYSNDYIHAPTMYDITKMKNRKLKFGLGVFGGVAFGTFVPIFAVFHQQHKANAGTKVLKH
jgi:hypothetical protein